MLLVTQLAVLPWSSPFLLGERSGSNVVNERKQIPRCGKDSLWRNSNTEHHKKQEKNKRAQKRRSRVSRWSRKWCCEALSVSVLLFTIIVSDVKTVNQFFSKLHFLIFQYHYLTKNMRWREVLKFHHLWQHDGSQLDKKYIKIQKTLQKMRFLKTVLYLIVVAFMNYKW